MVRQNSWFFLGGVVAVAVLAILTSFFWSRAPISEGSTVGGNDYVATSTAFGAIYGAQNFNLASVGNMLIKGGYGSFGSVIITGANTGVFNLYNATTTNVNLRTNNTPSSTILLASFPASAAAGTYTFDEVFTTGLLLDLISGQMPTTTITYRQ